MVWVQYGGNAAVGRKPPKKRALYKLKALTADTFLDARREWATRKNAQCLVHIIMKG